MRWSRKKNALGQGGTVRGPSRGLKIAEGGETERPLVTHTHTHMRVIDMPANKKVSRLDRAQTFPDLPPTGLAR